MSDIFDMFGVVPTEADPKVEAALDDLALALELLEGASEGFDVEPPLGPVAEALDALLTATGRRRGALAAHRWSLYERSGRRKSKIREARLRADALYRGDLDAIEGGREGPPIISSASQLAWVKPGEPSSG